MTETRSWGQTVIGWFIEQDDRPQAAPSADGPPPSADAAAPAVGQVFAEAPPAAIDGRVDFDGVFAAAGIAGEARERVTKAADLLGALPPDTPAAVKKQIVEASLTAFGVPIDQIIQAGVAEIRALEGYIQAGSADTQRVLADGAKRIALYEDEIRQLRAIMDQRVAEQQAVVRACNAQKLTVQQVLEFFGQEAVARVVGTPAAAPARESGSTN